MKYAPAGESRLMRAEMERLYGADFVQQYADFENTMPLVARGAGFVASHAPPGVSQTWSDVAGRTRNAFEQLTWTNNVEWDPSDPQHAEDLHQSLQAVGADQNATWIVGHRPVQDALYRSQLDGQLVQINAPNDDVIAIVGADGRFDPARDVVQV